MASPPLREAASARADYSRDPDLRRNPLTYSDPTGEQAIRNLLNGGGPYTITAENGFRLFCNKQSLEYMLLGMTARVSRGHKLWVDPIQPEEKNTPAAGSNANQDCGRGPTNTYERNR